MSDRSQTAGGSSSAWSRTTWVLFLLVIVTAASTLVKVRHPDLPGTLRLGVVRTGTPQPVDQVLAPLARYLGQELHRHVVVEAIEPGKLKEALVDFDLALVPLHGDLKRSDVSLLAWAKPAGRSGWRSAFGILRSRDTPWPPPPGSRLIFGDGQSWSGSRGCYAALRAWGWSEEEIRDAPRGKDPFDHQSVIAALVYGAFDYAVVRESAVTAARRIRRLPAEGFVYTRVGQARGDFALVAGEGLSPAARKKVRVAALNLDHYRQDPARQGAGAASHALGELGLAGFAPDELLPDLRP